MTGLTEATQVDVIASIHGTERKIVVVKQGAKEILKKTDFVRLGEALGRGFFGKLKTYRDDVIHARHLNPATGLSIRIDFKGEIWESLVELGRLNTAYDLLVALRKDLEQAIHLINSTRLFSMIADSAPEKARVEAEVTSHRAEFQRCHSEMLALPRLPEFPSESQLQAEEIRWNRERQVALMDWFQPLSQPSWLRPNMQNAMFPNTMRMYLMNQPSPSPPPDAAPDKPKPDEE